METTNLIGFQINTYTAHRFFSLSEVSHVTCIINIYSVVHIIKYLWEINEYASKKLILLLEYSRIVHD